MDDKKNQNEKIMKYISNKLKQGEIPLMLQTLYLFTKSVKEQAKLVITSSTLYFLQNFTIKKFIKAISIQCVAVTPFSNELIIFYDSKGDQSGKDAVRIQSQANFKIIQDIISVRERFCEMQEKLPVIMSATKNLETLALSNQNSSKSKIFGFLFKKKEDKVDLRQRFSGQGELLYVNQSNFALEIGEKMYNHIYKNVKLLYISNSDNFRFFQQRYDVEQLSNTKRLFRLSPEFQEKEKQKDSSTNKEGRKNVLMRKINKKSAEEDKLVEDALRAYKNQEYKQQLLFAIETETHFEILTAMFEGQRDCQTLLLEHEFLSEKDLRSIFFKLVQMIETSSEIFYSLSPENIIIGKHGFRVSKIFSCLKRRSQLDYLAPEEFCSQTFSALEVQLINLWKVGILMFQLAFGNVPFAAEYVAQTILQHKQSIQIRFPFYILRTQQFQAFIKSILRIRPYERGLSTDQLKPICQNNKQQPCQQNWKNSLMKCLWLKSH